MPYIPKSERATIGLKVFEQAATEAMRDIQSPGGLNYMLTTVALVYLKSEGLSYTTLNSILGALDAVSHELKEQILIVYEDIKRAENGDLPGFEWAMKELAKLERGIPEKKHPILPPPEHSREVL